jgi:hypothetical protein
VRAAVLHIVNLEVIGMKRLESYCFHEIDGKKYLAVMTRNEFREELYLDIYMESTSPLALEVGYGISGCYELLEDSQSEVQLLMRLFPYLLSLGCVSTNKFQSIVLKSSDLKSLSWEGIKVESFPLCESDAEDGLLYTLDKASCDLLSIEISNQEPIRFGELRSRLPKLNGWDTVWVSFREELQLWAIRGDSSDAVPGDNEKLDWIRFRDDAFYIVMGAA